MTLRVLHVAESLGSASGGPSRTIPALCNHLAESGCEVWLCTTRSPCRYADCMLPRRDSVKVTAVEGTLVRRLRVVWSPRFGRTLDRICDSWAPSIIHSHGLWLPQNSAAARVARRRGLPLVVSTRGMLMPWSLSHNRLKKAIAWRLYQLRDLNGTGLLHVTSRVEAEALRSLGMDQPIAVIPNGVEIATHTRPPLCSTDERTALFLGRIHPVKGLLDLVEAWAALRPSGWRVVVAGPDEGGHRARVAKSISVHGLDEVFHFIGPARDEDKWRLLCAADVLVLPSYTENFGLVVAEALSCGVPVVTTKGTPWRDLVDERCGWWVETGASSFARALSEAISVPDAERWRMGQRGRALVQTKYAWPRIAADMTSAYEWILGGGQPPQCVLPG